MTDETPEQFAERMIRNEVQCCLSSLVSTLASGYGDVMRDDSGTTDNLRELTEQAFELACSVADYEEAARRAGWTVETIDEGQDRESYSDTQARESYSLETVFIHSTTRYVADASPDDACGWEALCREFDLDPYESEVYEHWAVSTWFAAKLAEHGEKVDTDFAGLNVWARQCTGQAITADAVVMKIARECLTR